VTRGTLDLRTEYSFARSEEGERFLLEGLAAALTACDCVRGKKRKTSWTSPCFP
jgi:hypothetical protein